MRSVTFSDGGQTLVTSKVRLPAGSNCEIVVHLPASPTGDPVVTRFDNNLQSIQRGRAAMSVAHVAAAGPMDIRVDKKVVFANVANGEYTYKVVPAKTNSVDFVRTGKSKTPLGPVDMMLEPEKLTWVFAIGRPGKDLTIVKHVIALADRKGSNTQLGSTLARAVRPPSSRPEAGGGSRSRSPVTGRAATAGRQ